MKQKFESFKITTHVSIYGNLRLSGQRDVVLIIEFWGFIGLQIVRYFLSLLLLLLLHIINRDYLLNFIMLETMPLFPVLRICLPTAKGVTSGFRLSKLYLPFQRLLPLSLSLSISLTCSQDYREYITEEGSRTIEWGRSNGSYCTCVSEIKSASHHQTREGRKIK